MKDDPLDQIEALIAMLSGDDRDMVALRRLFLRASGLLNTGSAVRDEIASFQTQAALVTLEIKLADGKDILDGKKRLAALFTPLRRAIEQARY